MLEYITLLIIVLTFILIKAEYKVLTLFIFLTPFNSFIKNSFTFFYGGGSIITYWKEIAILILLFKIYKSSVVKLNKQLVLTISFFILLIIFYLFMSEELAIALPTLRNYLFPILLFLSVAKLELNNLIFKQIIIAFVLSVLITNVFGIIQHFFLNEQLSQLMGRIDFIDSNGYIQYTTTSNRIMGFERMAGIIGGGPNMFGVFNGLAIVFIFGVLTIKDKLIITPKLTKILFLVLVLSIFGIILSFSRAGWAILVIGVFSILLFDNKKIVKYFIFFSFFSVIIVFVLSQSIPKVEEIISQSFSGKEVSAANRSSMILELLPVIADEPFGHGLGTTDNRFNTKQFFAESAFSNIAFEIGVLGLFFMIFMHAKILKLIRKLIHFNLFAKVAFSISLASLLVSIVSINPYETPYIFLWWFILGLGINKSNLKTKPFSVSTPNI